uniref:RNA-directed DNA polymerase n=1 Tax=Hibiscus soymovirus TaxID=3023608 RepID=A0AAF0Z0V3_9VIRU|nr:replicase [Hibiscus soymovirus]
MSKNSTFIKVKLFNKILFAYLDTGATICLGKTDLLPDRYWIKLEKPIVVRIANGKTISITQKAINLSLLIEGKIFPLPSIYRQNTGLPLIIGNNFLKLYQPFIQRLTTISLQCPQLQNQRRSLVTTKIYNTFSVLRGEVLRYLENYFFIQIEKCLITNIETEVEKLLDKICSQDPLDPVKNTNSLIVKIELIDPNKEINVPNNIPYTERDVKEFKEETDNLLSKGIIRESMSPHSAPAFYVENHNELKRGKRRMVINYKELNKATKGDAYKLPRQDYIFSRIKKARWYTTLDAKSGYWQLRLEESSKPLTAFSCPPQNQFEFNVMPFGIKQGPSQYQRFMDNNLKGLESISLAYIDDIIVFTQGTKQDHLNQLAKILIQLGNKGVVLSKEKAKIATLGTEFLGMKILEGGYLEPQEHLLKRISEFPDKLTDRNQIQRFLGCLTYIGEKGFIKDLARDREILQKMISEKIPWKWDERRTLAVQKLKALCSQLPKLYLAKPDDLLILNTDASKDSWGAILQAIPNAYEEFNKFIRSNKPSEVKLFLQRYQRFGKQRLAPHNDNYSFSKERFDSLSKAGIIYKLCKWSSGTFKSAEKNYTVHEKEVLALVRALEKFRIDLQPVKFIFQTDSTYTKDFINYKLKEGYNKGRILRWSLKVQQFDFVSLYIPGKQNHLADTLTREWSPSDP